MRALLFPSLDIIYSRRITHKYTDAKNLQKDSEIIETRLFETFAIHLSPRLFRFEVRRRCFATFAIPASVAFVKGNPITINARTRADGSMLLRDTDDTRVRSLVSAERTTHVVRRSSGGRSARGFLPRV